MWETRRTCVGKMGPDGARARKQDWKESLEFDNWGNPLPTASQATVSAWKAAKQAEKEQEVSKGSTYPYDPNSVLIK